MEMTNSAVSTPAAAWRQAGEPDPHAGHYNCERAKLTMGHLTDDELANGAFLNYDQPLNVQGILAGTHTSPIAWMTAVKDRIRWLSRALEQAKAERNALAARLTELEGQEPVAWLYDWQAPEGLIQDWVAINRAEIPEHTTNIRPLFARPVPAESQAGPWLAWALHVIRERCPDVVTSFQFERAETARAAALLSNGLKPQAKEG